MQVDWLGVKSLHPNPTITPHNLAIGAKSLAAVITPGLLTPVEQLSGDQKPARASTPAPIHPAPYYINLPARISITPCLVRQATQMPDHYPTTTVLPLTINR